MDQIRVAVAAKLETPDGEVVYVDSEIASLRNFAELDIQASTMEPADGEADWLYRITFDPAEKVPGGVEVVVAFHGTYVQVNGEYYLPGEGVAYETILAWAAAKFRYFYE